LAIWADAKSEFPIFVSDCYEEVSEKAFVRGAERDSLSLSVKLLSICSTSVPQVAQIYAFKKLAKALRCFVRTKY